MHLKDVMTFLWVYNTRWKLTRAHIILGKYTVSWNRLGKWDYRLLIEVASGGHLYIRKQGATSTVGALL